MQVVGRHGGVAALCAGFFEGFLGRACHDEVGTVVIEISRNTVSPPQLTADAPVLDVFKPYTVGGLVLLGDETDYVVHDRSK